VALRRDDQYEELDWRIDAACRGQHAGMFFPPAHFERKEARIARERIAKSVCRGCPVQAACLAYALQHREPHGVWGGLDEAERRAAIDGSS
jgi:WhiB family transcriptional regulator, redox-sensing transcriptional regulator